MKIFRNIAMWFRKKYSYYTSPKFKFETVEDSPVIIPEKKILIVDEGTPESLVFKCPCGCNADIHLNLLKDARPLWNYKITKKGNITISPSVWRKVGCKSHFFIREGRIEWV
jgi:hypothetical protein